MVDYDKIEAMAEGLKPLQDKLKAAQGTDQEPAARKELLNALRELNDVLNGIENNKNQQ